MSDELRIPTKEEIAQLPRWAIVAFAVRCARRVQPIFTLFWPDAPKKPVKALDDAITFAENAAGGASVRARVRARFSTRARVAVRARVRACDHIAANPVTSDTASFAADAAATAADTANVAANAGDTADVAHTANAAAYATALCSDSVVALILKDFDILRKTAEHEHWTDKTPVPQKVFGPMWPDGEPDWKKLVTIHLKHPKRAKKDVKAKFYEQPPLEVYINPGNASKETIQAVFEALSDWHRTAGGLGLEFTSDGNFVYATDEVLV